MNDENSIALGSFDGLHAGHLRVIELAKQGNYNPCLLLFDVHPLSVINGAAPPALLLDETQIEMIKALGMTILPIKFSDIVELSPEEFFNEILLKKFNAKVLCCGENYTFGKYGKGDVELLKRLCDENGIELRIAGEAKYLGETISSTRIREMLKIGDVEAANDMLTREFSYKLPVVSGDKRGRTLGFPTVNQFFPDSFIKLKFGVYATKSVIDGKLYASVTNIGIRPTFDTEKPRSETYIIGYDGDLYGKDVEIRLVKYLRDEKKFDSAAELCNAIEIDSKHSQDLFNNTLEKQ